MMISRLKLQPIKAVVGGLVFHFEHWDNLLVVERFIEKKFPGEFKITKDQVTQWDASNEFTIVNRIEAHLNNVQPENWEIYYGKHNKGS